MGSDPDSNPFFAVPVKLQHVALGMSLGVKTAMSLKSGCITVMLAMFTVSDSVADQPGLDSSEFVYESAPFPQCHASTLAETSEGLVAAWFGGTHEKNPDVGIWSSRQIKGQWTPPQLVADGVQYTDPQGKPYRHPCWNPVLFQPQEGPLLLFYKCGPSPSTWWGMLTQSNDQGKTWTQPRRLPQGIDGPVKNKPIQFADGTILCGCSTEFDGWRVHLERTTDLGRTWQRTNPINGNSGPQAIQPSLLSHSGNRLQLICRNRDGQGSLWQSWSSDGGITWSSLESLGLPNPNAGTDAVTLADGRQLLVYNHTNRRGTQPAGRSMLNVAVSEDGRKWFAALVLEKQSGSEFSYPAVIQTSDGKVHISYTWKRRRVKHAVVVPDQLTLQPIIDGKWPE